MRKAVLVDDERLVLDLLKRRILERGNVSIIGEFTDSEEALEKIPGLKPDIVFLDVEMPEINGIELGAKLLEYDDEIEIVFVTAYEQYAIQAFKLNALHYILKPVDQESIDEVLRRISQKKRNKDRITDSACKIYLFGDICILNSDNKRISWITSKAEELFILLLLNRDKGTSKWKIMEELWPETDTKKSQQNLYTTIFRLKRTLSDAGIHACIENNAGYYNMVLKDVYCDLFEFEDFVNTKVAINEDNYHAFKKAISLYRDDLLGSNVYAWSILHKENCYEKYVELVNKLAGFYKRMGYDAQLEHLYKKTRSLLMDEDVVNIKKYRRINNSTIPAIKGGSKLR